MPLLNTQPSITVLESTRLIGIQAPMSLLNDQTPSLWKTFMPRLKEVTGRIGEDFYSLQEYPADYFRAFQPDRVFKKWAAAKVNIDQTPLEGMEFLSLKGAYAVFEYQGLRSDFGNAIRQILTGWLPGSEYELDDRPHFERLDHRYKQNDPESVEEIWIPVRVRG